MRMILVVSLYGRTSSIRIDYVETYTCLVVIESTALVVCTMSSKAWQSSAEPFITDHCAIKERHLNITLAMIWEGRGVIASVILGPSILRRDFREADQDRTFLVQLDLPMTHIIALASLPIASLVKTAFMVPLARATNLLMIVSRMLYWVSIGVAHSHSVECLGLSTGTDLLFRTS